MATTTRMKTTLHAPFWPMFRRVERQAGLFGEMIERLDADPGAAAREDQGRSFAAASRRCLWCSHADECRAWLDGGGAGAAPLFCPNAAYLNRVRSAKDGL
jgi:hypothetical protein